MRPRFSQFALLCTLTGTLLCASASEVPTAHASLFLAPDLEELIEGSDEVVIVRTLRTVSHYDEHGSIVTDAELWVEGVEKGDCEIGETILVRSRGGVVDGIGMRVSGEPVFVEGERQLLFARWEAGRRWLHSAAMSAGRMRIEERSGQTWVLAGGEGLTPVERAGGKLRSKARRGPRHLTALLSDIRAHVSRKRL